MSSVCRRSNLWNETSNAHLSSHVRAGTRPYGQNTRSLLRRLLHGTDVESDATGSSESRLVAGTDTKYQQLSREGARFFSISWRQCASVDAVRYSAAPTAPCLTPMEPRNNFPVTRVSISRHVWHFTPFFTAIHAECWIYSECRAFFTSYPRRLDQASAALDFGNEAAKLVGSFRQRGKMM